MVFFIFCSSKFLPWHIQHFKLYKICQSQTDIWKCSACLIGYKNNNSESGQTNKRIPVSSASLFRSAAQWHLLPLDILLSAAELLSNRLDDLVTLSKRIWNGPFQQEPGSRGVVNNDRSDPQVALRLKNSFPLYYRFSLTLKSNLYFHQSVFQFWECRFLCSVLQRGALRLSISPDSISFAPSWG